MKRIAKRAMSIVLAVLAGMTASTSVGAAQYHSEEVAINIEVWPEKVWDYFRFFCSALVIGDERSTCITDFDGIGAIRQLSDGRQDLLVARGPLSQTYEIIGGPMAELDLHVTLSVVPREDPLTSTITATMIWDEEMVPEDRRLAVQYDITSSVTGQMTDVKYQAEAS